DDATSALGRLPSLLGVAAALAGVAGVYASARLYLVPARPVWNSRRTPVAFFATAVSVGPLVALLCLDRTTLRHSWIAVLIGTAAAGTLVQVAVQTRLGAVVRRRSDHQHQGTAQLLDGELRGLRLARLAAAAMGLGLLAFSLNTPLAGTAAGGRLAVALVVIAAGELIGRYLFYVSVVPFRPADGFFGNR
ncbi:MAG: dimethyl sulfoxide reductase anchor subunit, partial [Acidimicrobiia bacterium]|nr:dimethyl sulfoxide reductase anchor subunit [Acidimicrobiia bacterium]